ncbi:MULTISPECIES: outer membrane lipoprotein-sorting protein [Emticicia]|uniref:outer membrane lipoprotein-sorting protein n=1 Tax=Emticicia TaxID=312278 RepID=UPI00209E1D35|nr:MULTISPECIES: outer membrane lipoprotein-sorting protein [Emticicia]UTA67971.1 outer membrane lipoprotein-sorting protein [Emticicia sp. 21SJ11W-3]
MKCINKKVCVSAIWVIVLTFSTTYLYSQKSYRIKADISIKDKHTENTYGLTIGKVYYSIVSKKLVYKLSFPSQETIVIKDTILYKIDNNGTIKNEQRTLLVNEFTIFHLSLSGKLSDYGLSQGNTSKIYKVQKVEKDANGRVITTWEVAEKKLIKLMGKIKMANVDKKLDAIAFYDLQGKLLSQQFFKDYDNINGVIFPKQITQISYNADGTQKIQQTTFKNIEIDESGEDNIYDYPLPVPALPGSGKSPK